MENPIKRYILKAINRYPGYVFSFFLFLIGFILILMNFGFSVFFIDIKNASSEQKSIVVLVALICFIFSGIIAVAYYVYVIKFRITIVRPAKSIAARDCDYLYHLSRANDFYNLVAAQYDERTSENREKTKDLIVKVCLRFVENLDNKSVLDLGGGTGSLLRKFTHFNLRWVNVDSSPALLKIFRQNFSGNENYSCRQHDIRENLFMKKGEKFDLLILSFVISSMKDYLEFDKFLNLMHSDSILIIADNSEKYSANRLYGFELEIGLVGLCIRPISSISLTASLERAGFIKIFEEHIDNQETGETYSQVLAFKKK